MTDNLQNSHPKEVHMDFWVNCNRLAILTHSGLQATRKASCHGSKYCSASADPSTLIWCGNSTRPYLQFIDHNGKYNGEFKIIGEWTYTFLSCPFFPLVCMSLCVCFVFFSYREKEGGCFFIFIFYGEKEAEEGGVRWRDLHSFPPFDSMILCKKKNDDNKKKKVLFHQDQTWQADFSLNKLYKVLTNLAFIFFFFPGN